jgi:hypothetical protein
LAKLLPDWEVQHAIPQEREPDDTNEDKDLPPGRIATLMFAATARVKCDILVRATGGTGLLSWEYIRGGGKAGTTPSLLIDFNDEFDERAKADAMARRREYRQQGINVLRVSKEERKAT